MGRFVFGRFVVVPEQDIIIVLLINLNSHETIPLISNFLKLESSPTLLYYCSLPKLCFIIIIIIIIIIFISPPAHNIGSQMIHNIRSCIKNAKAHLLWGKR